MRNKNLAEIIKEIENSIDKSEKKQKLKRIIQNRREHAILSARIGTCNWILKMLKPLEAELREKTDAIKKMGLHNSELWLSRIVYDLLGNVPEESQKFLEKKWKEILEGCN